MHGLYKLWLPQPHAEDEHIEQRSELQRELRREIEKQCRLKMDKNGTNDVK